jgi:hypothetical protein
MRMSLSGDALGWWDDRTMLLKGKPGNLLLFDVQTRETTTLLSAAAIADFLEELGVAEDPTAVATILNWNGNGYYESG